MSAQRYTISIRGHLDETWTEWFDGFTITHLQGGDTVLSGPLPDQAALHGVLATLRDLNLPLLSVNRVPDGWAVDDSEATAQGDDPIRGDRS